jgi:hypothetical protein
MFNSPRVKAESDDKECKPQNEDIMLKTSPNKKREISSKLKKAIIKIGKSNEKKESYL